MMVGIAVGLFIVAAAALLVSAQLGDNRRLLLETQVQQDLRATADIITRELRRAGALRRAENVVRDPATGAVLTNPLIQNVTPGAGGSTQAGYNYERGTSVGPYGFKLDGRVIQTLLASGGWQDLTDRNVLTVTEFLVTADSAATERLPCPNTCPAPPPAGQPADYCWPLLAVRGFTVRISGHAASDSSVVRTVESRVRLRNEQLTLNNLDAAGSLVACPN
jgi:type IV pilus assembly protein PilW